MPSSFYQSRGLRSIALYLFVSAHSSEACAPFTNSTSSLRWSLENRSSFDESLVLSPDDFVQYSANLTCPDDPYFAGTGPAAVVKLVVTPLLRLTVSTCGAGLDTDLTVLTPTSCQPLACSGDAPTDKPRCQLGFSVVDFAAPSDGVVYLLIQPYANEVWPGNGTVRVTGSVPPPCRTVVGVFTSGTFANEVHWAIDDNWIGSTGPPALNGPYERDAGGTEYSTEVGEVGCLTIGNHTLTLHDVYSDGWSGGILELKYADASPSAIGKPFSLPSGPTLKSEIFTVAMLSPFAPPDPPAPPGPPPMIPAPPSAPLPPALPTFPACECEYGVRLKENIPQGTSIPTENSEAGMPEIQCAGDYVKDGRRTPDGCQMYKKLDSSHYMYWWAEFTNWRVSLDITESFAICASWSGRDGPCPEQASEWRQIADDSEYRPDTTMTIGCIPRPDGDQPQPPPSLFLPPPLPPISPAPPLLPC